VRSWEQLSAPVAVNWFPPSTSGVLVTSPAPGGQIAPTEPIRLTLSRRLSAVFGNSLPTLSPSTKGTWRQLDSHTLLFTPSGLGAPFDSTVALALPHSLMLAAAGGNSFATADRVTWSTPTPSVMRLQQLLAQQGYLPLSWTPSGPAPARTAQAQLAAAVSAPAGSFHWRYANTPAKLEALWNPHQPNVMIKGAVMTFEHNNGLAVDGLAGPMVWHALLSDALGGRRYGAPYSYVYVHTALPQELELWSGGSVILTSPGNTGIPSRPTKAGTFTVFEHIPVGTMSGTNPDGTHYHDPGIRWISYFNGSDAVHAFPRAAYGTPQSLGCVELPLAAAAKAWPYMPIGTLVTIENSPLTPS
jgi:peptidoglycan hydrolase-like protein with peptidoglycan-binding domain